MSDLATTANVVVAPVVGAMYVAEVTLPAPGPRQVVVQQHASGVCHTQVHALLQTRTRPLLLGHESYGTVVAVGSDVQHVLPGDSVMVTWMARNRHEARTWHGGLDLDLGNGEVAHTDDVFTWADHTLVDQSFVVKVPTPGTTSAAVVGCAVMTGAGAVLHSAGVQPGDSVAVIGVGGVGLCTVAAAAHVGAHPIIAVDLDPGKLEFARRFGATDVVDASGGDSVAQIRALTADTTQVGAYGVPVAGVDFAFDCTGVPATMAAMVSAARPGGFGQQGGTAVLVGVPQASAKLPGMDVLMGQKRILGSLGGSCTPDDDFPRFLTWHDEGVLDLDTLVTQRFAMHEVNEACAALAAGEIAGRAVLDFTR